MHLSIYFNTRLMVFGMHHDIALFLLKLHRQRQMFVKCIRNQNIWQMWQVFPLLNWPREMSICIPYDPSSCDTVMGSGQYNCVPETIYIDSICDFLCKEGMCISEFYVFTEITQDRFAEVYTGQFLVQTRRSLANPFFMTNLIYR